MALATAMSGCAESCLEQEAHRPGAAQKSIVGAAVKPRPQLFRQCSALEL